VARQEPQPRSVTSPGRKWKLAADGAVLAVPVGPTEQHGPHLPMATDTDVVTALAARLAARRRDVIVAPPVGYGSSGEHASFAGTISIGWDALELMLVELGRSAAETFGHVLFLSAHGGNDGPVTRATDRLRAESHNVVAWMPAHHPALVPDEALGLAAAPTLRYRRLLSPARPHRRTALIARSR
jgi:mycofactocin precursor peptide peptidase